ncbi:MAG: phenylacetic acid degradation bifunctional protein PaaZ, partial [Saprospiraceae bacterium]|nr:phenylacetic acid degradation bifunctional protein PaaZ [Saprospiraceae bacterium]
IKHYMQRCAIQGTPTTITKVTGIYQAGAKYEESPQHPFSYHFEDIRVGVSLKTHKRTITDGDIINFANLTWDHFYAHTDITSLEGSIFEKRAAHGYFLLAGAAGLFVYPNKGPVAANYGLEECRFVKPIYHNDTVYVRLTCKQKVERDSRGKELPAGVVKWYVEIFDAEDELVAMATILTLVQKKNPFYEFDKTHILKAFDKLTEESKSEWGLMGAQHMVEHLAWQFEIAMNRVELKVYTPEKLIDKYQEAIYKYREMPKQYEHPMLRKGEREDLKYESLDEAKQKLLELYDEYNSFFKENKGIKTANPVFGDLDKFEWDLVHRKHFHHHFKQFGLI